jgi:hypothetical protein
VAQPAPLHAGMRDLCYVAGFVDRWAWGSFGAGDQSRHDCAFAFGWDGAPPSPTSPCSPPLSTKTLLCMLL